MNNQTFTMKEFAEQCAKRGYVPYQEGGARAVKKWCKDHPKEFYTEDDMIAVYRYFNCRKIGDTCPKQHYEYAWTKDPM